MRMPLAPFLLAMMAGIATGNSIRISDHHLFVFFLFCFIFLLIAVLRKWKCVAASILLSAFFLIGILHINLYLYRDWGANHVIHSVTGNSLVVEGIISQNPETSDDKTELTVSTSRIIRDDVIVPVEGLVLLSVKNPVSIKYGDYVRFRARLKTPHNFNNPGGFDYEKHLRHRSISVRGFIQEPAEIVVLRENQGDIFRSHLERFRGKLKKIIRENSPSPEGEIIQAMILGDQRDIPKDVMEKFNKTGTTHIIAISGFNIGIVALFSLFIVRSIMKFSAYLLLTYNINAISTMVALIPVVMYTFIAGMGMSVVRATIMAVVFMMAIIAGKERNLYNTLAFAAFVILAISPHALFDISFQLSFVAVWFILYITPRFTAWIPKISGETRSQHTLFTTKTLRNILVFFVVSVSATIGTLPLIVFYFNRVSTVVLLANLLVVPVMGVIAIPLCTAIILAAMFSSALASLFVYISNFFIWLSVTMVDYLASLPGSFFFMSTPSLTEIILYYGFIITGIKVIDCRNATKNQENECSAEKNHSMYRAAFIIVSMLLLMDAIYLNTRDMFRENMRVSTIDVGQGIATLIEFPRGTRMLVDGGGFSEGSFDTGKYIVAPYLWHERIRRIDIVVMTHPHPDHLNGLIYILSHFGVGEVWSNGESVDSEAYREFMSIIHDKGIHHVIVSETTGRIEINNALIDIMNPQNSNEKKNESGKKFEDENNRSIVMKITFGNTRFLLPGDISGPTENRLVNSNHDIRSEILFVPHHGGFSSSTPSFLAKVKPAIAVVSCGHANIYKLPHPHVLQRYASCGAKVYRTDIHGAVSIETDGKIFIPTVRRNGKL
jgi:competence protein ComEC